MNRFQQLVPSGVLSLIGIWITYVSFNHESYEAQAFLFPKIVAIVFLVLAVAGLVSAILGLPDDAKGITGAMFRNMVPGIIVGGIYIFWAAAGMRRFKDVEGFLGDVLSKGLGFYTATALVAFVIISLYDPAPHGRLQSWVKRFVISFMFVFVMYLLFASVLGVFTPNGTFDQFTRSILEFVKTYTVDPLITVFGFIIAITISLFTFS